MNRRTYIKAFGCSCRCLKLNELFHWNIRENTLPFFFAICISTWSLDPQVRLAALRWPNHPRFNSSSPLHSCLRSSERKAFCVRAAGNGGWSWWYSRTLPQGERGTRLKMAAVKMCVQCVMWHPPPRSQWWLTDYWLSRIWTKKSIMHGMQGLKFSLVVCLGSAQCVMKQNYII